MSDMLALGLGFLVLYLAVTVLDRLHRARHRLDGLVDPRVIRPLRERVDAQRQ